jgi:plasmid maintenance system antidote protein VapI
LRLAHFFGSSPEFWLSLQSLYDPRLAQQKIRQEHQPPADAETARSDPRLIAEPELHYAL